MKSLAIVRSFVTTLFLFGVLVIGVIVYLSSKGDVYGRRVLIVKSGSMEPAIHTGDLIVTAESSEYSKGDIVSFITQDKLPIIVTHRIVDIVDQSGSKKIVTKGDFNQVQDKDQIAYEAIVGKYVFGIPYLGFLIDFAKTPTGVIVCLIIPASIIIYDELIQAKKAVVALIKRRKKKTDVDVDIEK